MRRSTVTIGFVFAVMALSILLGGCGSNSASEPAAPELPPVLARPADGLAAEDEAVRLAAVKALAAIEHEQCVDVLLPALDDASPNVRRWAVWALGRKKDLRATVAVIQMLEDPDANVRCSAVTALGHARDAKVVGHIANRLVDDSTAVRLAAADQLARLAPVDWLKAEEARIVPLAMLLLDGPNVALTRNVVVILQRISGQTYGDDLDWLDSPLAERAAVVEQWKLWHMGWTPPPPRPDAD